MLFKHYIWDFDGTIFDSYPHITACFKLMLDREHIKCDDDMIARHFAVSFTSARRYSGISDEGYIEFNRLAHLMYEDEIEPKVTPYPEIENILKKITDNGGDNYIYSHRNYTTQLYCRQYGLDVYFKDYITGENGFPHKPDPEALLWLMEKHSLTPSDCIMIGDREIDGLAGINAGMSGCLITDFTKDVNGNDPLEISAMPYKCRRFSELAAILQL